MINKANRITLNGETVLDVRPAGRVRRKAERDAELISLFERLKAENPDAAVFTLCRAIEALRPVRSQNMYVILRKYGRI